MVEIFNKAALSHQELMEQMLKLDSVKAAIVTAAQAITASLRRGGKVIFFGNGGSASDAMHITAEFVGTFERERKAADALCLNTNEAVMTALSNDFAYRYVFARQLKACVREGDTVIGLTTSGKSENVLEGFKCAKECGAFTIAMCGKNTEQLDCDCRIAVPSDCTPRVQEMHMFIGHCLAQYVEKKIIDGEIYDA